MSRLMNYSYRTSVYNKVINAQDDARLPNNGQSLKLSLKIQSVNYLSSSVLKQFLKFL